MLLATMTPGPAGARTGLPVHRASLSVLASQGRHAAAGRSGTRAARGTGKAGPGSPRDSENPKP